MNRTIDITRKSGPSLGLILLQPLFARSTVTPRERAAAWQPAQRLNARLGRGTRGSTVLAGHADLPDSPVTSRELPGSRLRVPTPCFSTSSTPRSAERSLDVVLKVFRCQVRDISVTFLTISYSNLILI